jgi:RNA-directed DNA polymerase
MGSRRGVSQTSYQMELAFESQGEALSEGGSEEAEPARPKTKPPGLSGVLMAALERRNLSAALRRVQSNRGRPGIDGMKTEELSEYLKKRWPSIRGELISGSYRPQPVLHRSIDKEGGGTRELGIPTVLDRFIQQALLQVLQPQIDPSFSKHSYGFRPGRSAHDAVKAARELVRSGRKWVVDVDLERFFDRVNHDVLMERLSRRIADKSVLRLIRRYLEAGILAGGIKVDRSEGTPQGGPLSPFLANLLLDEVDRELERRGHSFVRYADDCNVYVKSKRAGGRVLAWLRQAYQRLHLRINEAKSAVDRAQRRDFLGYSFYYDRQGNLRLRIGEKAKAKLKGRVRQLTRRRSRGSSLQQICGELRSYLLGWKNYFSLAETKTPQEETDGWIRRRLRALQLKHWKRGKTIFRELRARGLPVEAASRVAGNVRSWWRNSGKLIQIALPNLLFDQLGVPRLAG